MPPISSSGMTSEADGSRPGVMDEAAFIHEENAKVEREVEEEEYSLYVNSSV